MKKGILSLAILASLSMGLSASNADKAKNGSRERKSPMKELNLSADQQTQMQNLRQSYQVKNQSLKESYDNDLMKILTPEQKTKWEAMQKERAERKSGERKGCKKGKRGASKSSTKTNQSSTQG